nr:MAG TPA: ribosomal protein S6 [Bacteriophage sp.]
MVCNPNLSLSILKNPSEVLQSALSLSKPLSYPTSIVL